MQKKRYKDERKRYSKKVKASENRNIIVLKGQTYVEQYFLLNKRK